jgi:HEAT repeat protein
MAGKHKFEEQLAAVDALRQLPPEAAIDPLRKALANRNNLIAAKAADLVREFQLTQMTQELLAAFDRFFEDPVNTDPQCWAKNAISRTLADFEHQDADLFLRGIHHIQLEPSYGGPSDSAATLRATCALALVQCRSLTEPQLLTHLIELLGDQDKSVRVEAIRAIEHVNSTSAALLLRLRALLSPQLSPKMQDDGDDPAAEAALSIAGTHSPPAFETLKQRFNNESDPWFCSVLLSAIALTRQDSAVEFLLDQVRTESLQAEAAIAAILRAAPSEEVTKRLEKLVSGNPRLSRAFAKSNPTK